MSYSLLVIFFILLKSLDSRAAEKEGVFEKIKSGLQSATNYLQTAKEIADLVSRSLGHQNKNNNDYSNNNSNDKKINNEKRGDDGRENGGLVKGPKVPDLISAFFRLLGLDSSRIAAIAVNSVIFLAQMISSLFDVKPGMEESRARDHSPPFDPMRFIIENEDERVQRLVQQAQDPELPEQLINKLDEYDSSCARLLLCKSSPIILAAQNYLKNKTRPRRFDMTSWLPELEDFEDNADRCEGKYDHCNLFPDST